MSPKYSRSDDSWLSVLLIQKILFKNQRPPAEVARPLPGAILIPPALLVVADLMVNRLISKARSGHLSTTCCCAKYFQFGKAILRIPIHV